MAAIRAAEAQGGSGMVLKRGDPGSGVIMLKVMNRGGQAVVYSQTRSADGRPVWFRSTGADPAPEADIAWAWQVEGDLEVARLVVVGAERNANQD